MIAHPIYPLQHEQRAAIIMDARTQADVERIHLEFARRRDREFPGWREKYEAEVSEWIKAHNLRTNYLPRA